MSKFWALNWEKLHYYFLIIMLTGHGCSNNSGPNLYKASFFHFSRYKHLILSMPLPSQGCSSVEYMYIASANAYCRCKCILPVQMHIAGANAHCRCKCTLPLASIRMKVKDNFVYECLFLSFHLFFSSERES